MQYKSSNAGKNILVVDDEYNVREILKLQLEKLGYHVTEVEDGVKAINLLSEKNFDIVISDIKMPRVSGLEVLKYVKDNYPDTEVIMITAYDDMQIAIEAMKLKAYEFLTKPFNYEQLILTVERALEKHKLEVDNKALKLQIGELKGKDKIIGSSKIFLNLLDRAKRVAATGSNVLIIGESGTGKELLASFIHKNSNRKERPYVTINCASIPDTLLESELFGHEKGSYTDAHQLKQGLVEIAKDGSLFLDEIGDISLVIQPKLLRFIETGEFRRIGGTHNFSVDVRIIAATNKKLDQEVKNGKFREDLFYRINVVLLELPTLRSRKEDIPLLVEHFLQSKTTFKNAKYFSPEALEFLQEHDWPGNIRELEHVVEASIIFSKTDRIEIEDIPIKSKAKITHIPMHNIFGETRILSLDDVEKEYIKKVLNYFNWNQTKAAKALNITQKTLYSKIRKYNIDRINSVS